MDDDVKARDRDTIITDLEALDGPIDLQRVTDLLRELTGALVEEDDLSISRYREAAAQALKGKLQAPTGLIDSALREVRSSRGGDSSQGRVIELALPEPWEEPVDAAELLKEIVAVVERHVVLVEHAAVAIALWVLHSHAVDAAWITPRLAITSPVMRCGKSLLLIVLEHLVAKPLNVANVTAAAVFRGIEQFRPTLLVDEADTFLGDKNELRGILNSGHRQGGSVLRVVGDKHEVRAFATFAPVAIAMIGRLPVTLADRSIPIPMRRKKAKEKVKELRLDRVGHLEVLRRKATRWALDREGELKCADPEVPAKLHDRAADNWRPLLAIADLAGSDWSQRARQAATKLSASMTDDDEDAVGIVLLGDLRRAFEAEGIPTMFTDLILAHLCSLEDRPWAEWRDYKPLSGVQLAKLLRPFGIKPKQLRIGKDSRKGYQRSWFEDAFARYLPPLKAKHPKQPSGDKDLRAAETRNMDGGVSGAESAESPATTGVVSGVSGPEGDVVL